jgi:hypothetical protein
MDVTGFHSAVANRAQMCSADCHEENNLSADCHEENNRYATVKSLNLRADCHGIFPVVANRGTLESGLPRGYSCRGKPWYWSMVCRKRGKSSTSHFTLTVSLFAAPYIFDARLYTCKTKMRWIV